MGQDWSEVWLQKFSGTVTIWPKSVPSDFYYILSDPSPERLARMLHVGQRSTFGKIQFTRNRWKIEKEIVSGLHRFCPSPGGRVAASPRRDTNRDREREPGDPMVERLDNAFPERFLSNYKDESRYVEVPDNVSTNSSRAHTPDSPRGSIVEELRRQSSVFFDDADMYREDGNVSGD